MFSAIILAEGNIQTIRAQDVKTILHCGDVSSPHVIRWMEDFDLWVALGNTDNRTTLEYTLEATFGQNRLAWVHRLTFDGTSIAMIHGDSQEMLNRLIQSGQYMYVLHGHTHRTTDEIIGHTRVINPGALGGTYRQPRSYCILDLETGIPHFYELSPHDGL